MTKIKICGLKRPEDIWAVNEAKPDFAGFIIDFPRSHRSISPERAAELAAGLDPEIVPVGVFVDADPALPARLLNEGIIRVAQLHGHESEDYIRELRGRTDGLLARAFVIHSAEDVRRAAESSADYILLDQGQGTGKTFDWSLVPEMERPFILAGGLGVENLAEAIRRLHPWAVDLSSGVETDQQKDPEKIRRAVKIVRELSATGKDMAD
ncbi:MAG: phosphoribosylanthranilate isomerase [Clostridiales bacterium]|nr:phosphoribosylanthranilate isomerase [Clostridiales bacterium]